MFRTASRGKGNDRSFRHLLFASLCLSILLAVPSVQAADAPTELQAQAGRDHVDLSWQPVDDASYYNLYRGDQDQMVIVAKVTAPFTAYHDGGMEDGSTFLYYVTAVVDGNESAPGNSVSVTVPAREQTKVLLPVLALVLAIIAIQVCVVMLLYFFKMKMR